MCNTETDIHEAANAVLVPGLMVGGLIFAALDHLTLARTEARPDIGVVIVPTVGGASVVVGGAY